MVGPSCGSTQLSSTHNESRLAACPLSGVRGARWRSLSTNTQGKLENVQLCLAELDGTVNKVAAVRPPDARYRLKQGLDELECAFR
jgi:hypothetical protein